MRVDLLCLCCATIVRPYWDAGTWTESVLSPRSAAATAKGERDRTRPKKKQPNAVSVGRSTGRCRRSATMFPPATQHAAASSVVVR